jgi:quinohemoprotein ethanol dehydrogenase
VPAREPGTVRAPELPASEEELARGESLYATHCARCHGFAAQGTGFLPDLRHAAPEVHASWDGIVLDGALSARGMASFGDLLDADDSRAIHAYVVREARREPTWTERGVAWARRNLCIPTWLVAD